MGFYIIGCFFVIQILIQDNQVLSQSNEKDDLLQWYYKQYKQTLKNENLNRIARQIDNNYDYNDNNNNNDNNDDNDDDSDEWYVFDRVEEPQINNNARSFAEPSWQNNQNQINPNNRLPRPTTQSNPFFTTTTPRPVLPNAGPPRLPPCEENCNARTTSEYNPVCGTNGVTYFNNARFECANFCGKNIGLRIRGRCGPLLPRN